MTLGENGVFIKNLRQLKPQVIADISKAVMKLILNLVGEKVCLFVNLTIFRFQTLEMKEIFSRRKRFLPKLRG